MEPDQVAALERARADLDAYWVAAGRTRQRRMVSDWSIWECIAVQGLTTRATARSLDLTRAMVRAAMGRIGAELSAAEDDYRRIAKADTQPQLWPPY